MISILSRVGVSARRMQAAANVSADGDRREAPTRPATGSPDAPWQIIDDQYQIQHVLRHILHELGMRHLPRYRLLRLGEHLRYGEAGMLLMVRADATVIRAAARHLRVTAQRRGGRFV